MTKKDFEAIAGALNAERREWEAGDSIGYTGRLALDRAAWRLADALASSNPRFDRGRFLRACGVA